MGEWTRTAPPRSVRTDKALVTPPKTPFWYPMFCSDTFVTPKLSFCLLDCFVIFCRGSKIAKDWMIQTFFDYFVTHGAVAKFMSASHNGIGSNPGFEFPTGNCHKSFFNRSADIESCPHLSTHVSKSNIFSSVKTNGLIDFKNHLINLSRNYLPRGRISS